MDKANDTPGSATLTSSMPAAGWQPPASADAGPARTPWHVRLLPAVGPLVLFVIWDVVVRAGSVSYTHLTLPTSDLV